LDAVESTPHEVERLMSLLEEGPTLAVYGGVKPLLFHRPRFENGFDFPPLPVIEGAEQIEERVEIRPNFQIFITCRDPRKLSPALRSRCFCVHIETATSEQSLQKLAKCILSLSGHAAIHRNYLSRALAKVYSKTKPSATQALLFSQDTFSPHRIVNCARGLGNDAIRWSKSNEPPAISRPA
jgi:hypothetical protein